MVKVIENEEDVKVVIKGIIDCALLHDDRVSVIDIYAKLVRKGLTVEVKFIMEYMDELQVLGEVYVHQLPGHAERFVMRDPPQKELKT